MALSEAAREPCWLRRFPQLAPNLIRGDNNGSIAIAKNPQFHKRTKHIESSIFVGSCRVLTKASKHRQHTGLGSVLVMSHAEVLSRDGQI